MPVPAQNAVRNRLLAALPPQDYEELRPRLEAIEIRTRDVLVAPHAPIDHVYFPESGIVSTVAVTEEGYRIEIGIVGREGLVGVPLALGVDRTPHESFVQLDGEALRLPANAFVALLDAQPALRLRAVRFAHVFQLQTAQTALANGAYDIPQRLARWLLMCADRLTGDEFALTHEFLAMMLGVRRPGVTAAIHVLEGAGMIRARRARITILDRAKLLEAAGGSYGVSEGEYQRLLAAPT